jgi:hypothetical protein
MASQQFSVQRPPMAVASRWPCRIRRAASISRSISFSIRYSHHAAGCPLWVKSGKTRAEHFTSAFHPTAAEERTSQTVSLVPKTDIHEMIHAKLTGRFALGVLSVAQRSRRGP